MPEPHIRPMHAGDRSEWQRMHLALWPDLSPLALQDEMAEINADPLLPRLMSGEVRVSAL
jgi:hypothetical protein